MRNYILAALSLFLCAATPQTRPAESDAVAAETQKLRAMNEAEGKAKAAFDQTRKGIVLSRAVATAKTKLETAKGDTKAQHAAFSEAKTAYDKALEEFYATDKPASAARKQYEDAHAAAEKERMKDPMFAAIKRGRVEVGMSITQASEAQKNGGWQISDIKQTDTAAGTSMIWYNERAGDGVAPYRVHFENGIVVKVVR
jgi:hypothetical protein